MYYVQCVCMYPVFFCMCSDFHRMESALALSLALKNLTALTVLDLSNNYIYSTAIQPLAASFPYLTQLQVLQLGSNFIGMEQFDPTQAGDEGTMALAHGLSTLKSLTSLDLLVNTLVTLATGRVHRYVRY